MGTIIYDPRQKKNKKMKEVEVSGAEAISVQEVKDKTKDKMKVKAKGRSIESEERYNALIENIDSVRPMGDTDCDYVIYLEDYVYTYIYQYANTDLSCEHSAAIIGEYYPDSKEMIICGIMPIAKDNLSSVEEWINEGAIQDLQVEKERYFPGARILGWLHMQPGYGTMLTMKEVKAHREVFEREGTLLLLVDPINKIETFYVYEDDTLKEQSGYYMYYDKNPCMQQYMLDRPFIPTEKEETEDGIVNQFREIGRMRKKEYEQKKKMNLTVVAASIALLALSAVMLKVNDQNGRMKELEAKLAQAAENQVQNQAQNNTGIEDDSAKFVIDTINPEEAIDASTPDVKIVDLTQNESLDVAKEDQVNQEESIDQEAISAEEVAQEEPVKEEIVETVKAIQEDAATDSEKDTDEDYLSYTVQEGDSLRKISQDHYQTELRAKEIIKLNDLENGDQIHVGQVLKLPAE